MAMDSNQNVEISKYYDEFSKRQTKIGANIRIRNIFIELTKIGINNNSNILEIGCGVGVLTQLIRTVVKKGKIVSTDISPECIIAAKSRNSGAKNIDFFKTDMLDFSSDIVFDYIVMADVLEHIPLKYHQTLFEKIKTFSHRNSIVFINIPSPFHILYLQNNYPETLQIIDQPLFLENVLPNVVNNDFYVSEIKSYSLFHNFDDYQFLILHRNIDLKALKRKNRSQLIYNEISSRFRFLFRRLFY